ncbi:MAG: hypothetical protein DMF82_12525, partial [Acidobacteria bacterium]
MFLTLTSVNTLYQFWIHTRVIGRLGPLEWVLNTPSNHRVHHGRDPKYIDRNHGGTLIVWDRLFGTYQVEEEDSITGPSCSAAPAGRAGWRTGSGSSSCRRAGSRRSSAASFPRPRWTARATASSTRR